MFKYSKAFSGFAVSDLEAAKDFYEKVLGVRVTEERGLLTLDLGDRDVLVYAKPGHNPADYTILNFRVDDIEHAVDELRSAGVEFNRYPGLDADERGIHRTGGPYIAWFNDPSGNVLSVLQER